MSDNKIKRRTFVTGAAAVAGAAALVGDDLIGAKQAHAAPSNVYSAYHAKLVTGTTVSESWVQAAMDACVKAMTGQTDVGKAWAALFPGITTSKKIGIKINCLNTNVYPQFETVKAMVTGMTKMLGGTYPAGNISLFDNNLWKTGKVDACFTTAKLNALGIKHGEDTYAGGASISISGTSLYASKFWTDSDYGISLAKMAPHQYYAGGLSGVIKNMMGALSINNSASYTAKKSGSNNFHSVAPYTAFVDLFKNYGKANLQLYIVDMLFACVHENSSGWSKVVNRITMGTDPCAVDAYNVDKINSLNMAVKKTVTKDVPNALAAAGIGSTSYNLVEPKVGAAPTTRDEIDAKIRDRRAGKATDAEVKAMIKKYRGGQ
jgi:uncharacterized protein (DUF362 family)